MYVYCPKCYNHFDDTSQSKKCTGPGSPGHTINATRPADEAKAVTRAARIDAALGGMVTA